MADKEPTKEFLSQISNGTLIRLQARSGAFFALFLTLHVITIFSANISVSAFSSTQNLFRRFYQNPIVEVSLVLGSLLTHIATNMTLKIREKQREKRDPKAVKSHHNEPLPQKLNHLSGIILTFVIFVHMIGFRGDALFDPSQAADFSKVTFTLHAKPIMFYTYYLVFGTAGLYHMCYGLLKASDMFLHTKLLKVTKSRWFLPVMVAIPALLMSSIYAFSGGYFDVRDSREKVTLWAEHFESVSGQYADVVAKLSRD